MPWRTGRAAIDFHRGHYDDALRRYRTVLSMCPSCPPSVRVALGMCFARLGRLDKAQACFDRAVALDPNNVDALVGLATLLINQRTVSLLPCRGVVWCGAECRVAHTCGCVLGSCS